jgi:hypothetical protein
MAEQKGSTARDDTSKKSEHKQPTDDTQSRRAPKPESTSEYEGAPTRKPTGNPGDEVKTETSSTSGQ